MHQHPNLAEHSLGRVIYLELRHHAPFTLAGGVVGVLVALLFVYTDIPHWVSHRMFEFFHPGHVFFSAIVTTAMFRLHKHRNWLVTVLIGYVGSVGIGTLSDSLLPYFGELILGVHDPHIHAHAHIGFIEEWYLVNPAALLGVGLAFIWPHTKFPHAAHVLLSTGASLAHMLMAITGIISLLTIILIPVFLFVAVWVPCCTSDIVFPLLFTGGKSTCATCATRAHEKEGNCKGCH